jgi:signal transduction histidine kinase
MLGTPDNSLQEKALDFRKGTRAQMIGIRILFWAFPLFCLSAAASFYWRLAPIGYADLLGAGACLLSLWMSRKSNFRSSLFWIPAYSFFWISSFCLIWWTGGISSPFCGGVLILSLLAGVLVQARYSSRSVSLFALLNFIFWVFVSLSGLAKPAEAVSIMFICVQTGIYVLGTGVCLLAFAQEEKKLDQEAEIQDQKLIETRNQLAHTLKIAEAGDLLATTAHELAQPVQVISISSSLLAEAMLCESKFPLETQKKLLNKINESSTRLVRLLTQLRNFARKEPFQLQLLDLREAILSIQTLTEHDLRSRNIYFEFTVTDYPIWIRGDLPRIQQILLNLINNARDASMESSKPQVKICVEKHVSFARISVMNNGPQIPLAVQTKLFQPYFTTKCRGKGTGLGLVISADLVEQHKGRLFFSSEPDQTVFCVDFPEMPENGTSQQEKTSA